MKQTVPVPQDETKHSHAHTGHDEHSHLLSTTAPAHQNHTSPQQSSEAQHNSNNADQHSDHVDHRGHEQLFRTRFWVCLLFSLPVIVFSPTIQNWLGFQFPPFPGSTWIPFLFSLIIFAYGGLPFLKMSLPELRRRQPGMMTLISLAISISFVYSLFAQLASLGEGFFWELVTLIDVMLLGHWLEMRSVRQASASLDELAKLMPDTAERLLPDGRTETVLTAALQPEDVVLVRPGTSIPADGEVVDGESGVNESMVTGESRPVDKHPGAKVIAGTINGDGSLRLRVTATGDQTALAGIMKLVRQAQQSKSQSQLLADRAAGLLFYIALGVAALTAVGWSIASGLNIAVLKRVVTVLVIACPHALGLAVPLVVAITTALGARNGILVRDRLALEAARKIDVVVFDKTGTLTEGKFGVVNIAVTEDQDEDALLALAAAIEADSEHLIAQAVRRAADERGLALPEISEFIALKGRGVQASLEGQPVYVGGPRLLEMLGLDLPEQLQDFARDAGARSQSAVFLVVDDQVRASFAVADVLRPESKAAVERLHAMGIEVAMLTGDSREVAQAVADDLGIDHFFAEVLPEHKVHKVIDLQKEGKSVAVVGDGVNDAPALTQADVGIAIGGGTDVAIESAGLILVRSNPMDVIKIISLSRASYRKMIQNLWWAAGYNLIALPLAAGILAPWGILLSPAVGALLMSLSTVIVAINAQLLRGARL